MLSGEKMAPLAERRGRRDVKGALGIKVPARANLFAKRIEGSEITIVDRRRESRSSVLKSRNDVGVERDGDSSDDEITTPKISKNPANGIANTLAGPPPNSPYSPDTPEPLGTIAPPPPSPDTPSPTTVSFTRPPPPATTIVPPSSDTPSPTTVSFTRPPPPPPATTTLSLPPDTPSPTTVSFTRPPPPPPQVVRPTSIPVLQPPRLTTSSSQPIVTSATRIPAPIVAAPLRTTASPPAPVVTSFIPMMTTTPVEQISNSQPRKGVQPDTISTSSVDTPSPTSTSFPHGGKTPRTSAFIVSGSKFDVTETALPATDGDRDRMGDELPRRVLDPTAEHLLIAAGAIGAFILFSFIGWIILRTLKKSRRRGSGYIENAEGGEAMGRGGGLGLLGKLPWLRNENTSWNANGDTFARSMPLTYNEKAGSPVSYVASDGFQGADKALPYMGNDYRLTLGSQSQYSQNALPRPPLSVFKEPSTQSIIDQYSAPTGTQDSSDINLTMRSRMPDPFYNQSELARQPSDAYDPGRRQVYRASELSSISSGFGDGDIIIPPDATAQSQARSNPAAGRFSWMNRGSRRDRETVYTQSSEDQPHRFRTVTSWVDQQAGRVKRGHQATPGEDDVPALPGAPNEDVYLGLNGGEVARNVNENRVSGTTINRADELLKKRGA